MAFGACPSAHGTLQQAAVGADLGRDAPRGRRSIFDENPMSLP